MTLSKLVLNRLHAMMVQLAQDIVVGRVDIGLSREETAGVPLAIFHAENVMRRAFVSMEDKDERR